MRVCVCECVCGYILNCMCNDVPMFTLLSLHSLSLPLCMSVCISVDARLHLRTYLYVHVYMWERDN